MEHHDEPTQPALPASTMTSAEKSAAHTISDLDRDFIDPDDIRQFEKALNAPEASPVIAINDWSPINQRVRKTRASKPPKRSKDETREGVLYSVLKWPFLLLVFASILILSFFYILTRLYIYLYENFVTWRGTREHLRRRLAAQATYPDWQKAAQDLDAYLKNEEWKRRDEYAYYDHLMVNKVASQLKRARKEVESTAHTAHSQIAVDELRTLLEACVKNNFAGVENPRLYSEAYSGTKDLVQEYIDEVHACIRLLSDSKELSRQAKYEHFKHLDTNFGRTALCLSGGATFSYYHFGVVRALLDNNVLPEIITGTSGGALVAALVATRTDEELKQLLVPALAHRIRACHEGFTTWIRRFWRTGARFDTLDWARQCSWFCRGSMTFREAYKRTGRVLNVSCIPSDPHSPTILANHLTSPDCVIWSAVLASAAVPGILNPVMLMTKKRDGTLAPYSFGHKWKDGSLRTDIPIKALNLHFNVNFTIVSQVNPHINLFFFNSRGTVGRPVTHRRGRGWRGGFLGSAIEQYIKLDLNKWLKVLRHLELLPRLMGQDWSEVWLQNFSGTVTIWPKSVPSDYYYILSDPSPDRLARMLHEGQRSTFGKIQFVTNRLKIENEILHGLVRFSPSAANRNNLNGVGNGNGNGNGDGRVLSPHDRRDDDDDDDRERNPADPMVERLDNAFPERSSNYKDESRYVQVPDSVSVGSSAAHSPDSPRGSFVEELRRQSAVFFDDEEDSDLYKEEDGVG